MYQIELVDGVVKFINERRIIMEIEWDVDGRTLTLTHFNNSKIQIKSFKKL
jgi:hypothetical protein